MTTALPNTIILRTSTKCKGSQTVHKLQTYLSPLRWQCYVSFCNSYSSKLKAHAVDNDDQKWFKDSALNKGLHYIKECDKADPGIVLEVTPLENMYMDIKAHHDIECKWHSTTFAEMLVARNENIYVSRAEKTKSFQT